MIPFFHSTFPDPTRSIHAQCFQRMLVLLANSHLTEMMNGRWMGTTPCTATSSVVCVLFKHVGIAEFVVVRLNEEGTKSGVVHCQYGLSYSRAATYVPVT
jgi:predicted protein tyrosine phosphatase